MITTDFFIKVMLAIALGAAALLGVVCFAFVCGELRRMRLHSKQRRTHNMQQG